MARGSDKDPLDVEAAIAGLRDALPLQLRSAVAYTLAAASLSGFEHVGLAPLLASAGEADLADARRLAEKLTTLGGTPPQSVPDPRLPRAPKALVRRLIALEAETIERLQDIIPATGHTGVSEALEHRLEHIIMRKQEVVDALERARRGR
jgi:bacterioferritin (cytochrome b1)